MHHLSTLLAQGDTDSTKWVAILLGAFGLVYLMVLRPMMRGRKRDPLEQPPPRAGMAQQRAMERDMQTLLVEYEQMIRNMTAGLDTRAAKLELLIKEADEKLAALRAATAAAGAPPDRADPATARRDNITPPPVNTGPDPRHLAVYELADQGLSANDVARKLGRPSGEVELILALRGR